MIILGKNPGVVSTSSNTSDNNQEEFIVAKTMKHINLTITEKQINEIIDDSDTDTNSDDNEKSNINEMTEDAVEYLAGWIAKKYRQKFPELGGTTTEAKVKSIDEHDYLLPSWIDCLSYGGLIVPSNNFKKHLFRAERIFKKTTKQKIPKGPTVVKQLLHKIMNGMDIEEKYRPVIHTLVRQRIFIRMKYANKNHQILVSKRKAKLQLQKLQKLRKLMT